MPTCYRHPDRETGLSCSECGRPICTECMTVAPVGIRCPDHAGGTVRRPRINPPRVARAPGRVLAARITGGLIALNVIIYLITAVQGAGLNSPGGSLYGKWILYGPYVDRGDWWRLVTAMFLHGFLLHIVFNMVALWFVGRAVELYLGPTRFLLLYFVSGLAGSAGALVQSPTTPVVGASGAIFGILGALLILEWQATGRFAGQALTWIVINLVLNLSYGGNISIGGHIGGLIGGILVTLAFASWRRGSHRNLGGLTVEGALGLLVVAAGSIAIAYWKVRGLWPPF
ncbi:MAG TPA: rhomboid family intramembrane serine protease [Gaiellaceae bacterium]|nr:rhomboid family intramembrane serine protease [Gaiellaceae bacterium]